MAEVVAYRSGRYASYVPAVIRNYIGAWGAQRDAALAIDPYLRGEHALPIMSNSQGKEEQAALREIAQTPYGRLILRSCTQGLKVKGVRIGDSDDTPEIWNKLWMKNRMQARQTGIVRAAVGYGHSYTSVLPGLLGLKQEEGMEIVNYTPKTMTAFYGADHDEWPILALNGIQQVDDRGQVYWMFTVFDDEAVHYAVVRDLVTMSPDQMKITYLESRPHSAGVCPVVIHSPLLDDDGGSRGELLPFLPILKRIDQTVYDRLLIQRQAAWKVRYATSIDPPKTAAESERLKATLSAGDVLTAKDPGAKFGTLDASSMAEHVGVHEADLRDLAASSQTPPYMVTGEATNLSPEALAAISSGYHDKLEEYKDAFSASYPQIFELAAVQDPSLGDVEGLESRWVERRPYSLTQISDALGKLAQQLEIPPDQLFEYVPFFSEMDVERAKIGRQEAKDEAMELAQAEAAAASAAVGAQNRERGVAGDSNQNRR